MCAGFREYVLPPTVAHKPIVVAPRWGAALFDPSFPGVRRVRLTPGYLMCPLWGLNEHHLKFIVLL